ncbi:MAG: hypothetical protein ABIK11_03715, partial [candidate division WOR-3 bacterium]
MSVRYALLILLTIAHAALGDSLNCRQVGWCPTYDEATKLRVVGNYAYVADYRSGLIIIAVADPTRPCEVGRYDSPGFAYDVDLAGDY